MSIHFFRRTLPWVLALGFLLVIGPVPALAFGKNKLKTRDLHWNIFETEHFEVFFYPEEEALAREVCGYAEDAFVHDTTLLRYRPQEKTPLFIYRNQVDFQQTNISPSVIGVGTGGFTEAFKNRIALPAPASPLGLREVIHHELVHALQFDILYGEGLRSFRVYKGYLMPLWLIEGMAEYAAHDWDTFADMVVRDAVLHDRLVPLTLMDGFSHLEDVWLAYKESHLALVYAGEKYGEEKLAVILKKFKNQISLSQILRETLGVGLTEFNRDFLFWARQRYWVQANQRQPASAYGQQVVPEPSERLTTTAGPAWSPDGRFLAYVSDLDQTARVYVKRLGTASPGEAVTHTSFEYFSYSGRPLSWSPDGRRLAFVARQQGKNGLYLLEWKTGRLERQDLPWDDFYSPAWSPDGADIALVGVTNGTADIYLWHLATRTATQLTKDRWADNSPAWSPDGRTLVYSTERNACWQLASKDPAQPEQPEVLLSEDPCHHLQPSFTPDGRHLLFTADYTGIFNLYLSAPSDRIVRPVTDVRSGLFQPALAPDGKRLAFSVYRQGGYTILLGTLDPDQSPGAVPAGAGTTPAAVASAASDTAAARARMIFSSQEPFTAPPPEDVILSRSPYHFRFSPDLLFLLAGYDSSQGVVGGGYVTASDYLGDHLVTLTSNFIPGYQTRTMLSYGNFMFPIYFALTVAYNRNYYRLLDLETGALTDEFNDQETMGGLQLAKPFSLYDRLELEFDFRNLRREYQDATILRNVTSLGLSLVHDSTVWYDFDPTNGYRSMLSLLWADRILGGDANYSILQLNTQYYKSLDPLSPELIFGTRLWLATALGPEHPVFIFGGIGLLPESGTLRGYPYGELLGSQVAVWNFELRFPLARNINYALWPLDFLLLKEVQAVFFDDIGIVTNDFLSATSRELRNSFGLGVRLHTFLLGKELLTIRFDISQRTDQPAETVYSWGIGQAF